MSHKTSRMVKQNRQIIQYMNLPYKRADLSKTSNYNPNKPQVKKHYLLHSQFRLLRSVPRRSCVNLTILVTASTRHSLAATERTSTTSSPLTAGTSLVSTAAALVATGPVGTVTSFSAASGNSSKSIVNPLAEFSVGRLRSLFEPQLIAGSHLGNSCLVHAVLSFVQKLHLFLNSGPVVVTASSHLFLPVLGAFLYVTVGFVLESHRH